MGFMWGIFVTSLWIYGAMFAKRVWLKSLCIFMIAIGAIYCVFLICENFKKDISETIIALIISIIAYYIAYHLALFYKKRKDRKLVFVANSNLNQDETFYSKENLKTDSVPSKYDTDSNKNKQLETINKEVVLEYIDNENINKDNRIFCPYLW